MIEEKLIELGVSEKELKRFAKGRYNSQQRILLELCEPENDLEFKYNLYSVLKKLALENWETLFPGHEKKEEIAGQALAREMLITLSENNYNPFYLERGIRLNMIYEDTIKRLTK